jgi:esterase
MVEAHPYRQRKDAIRILGLPARIVSVYILGNPMLEKFMAAIGYETFGNGPIKLFGLHGWFADETAFRPITAAMSPNAFTFVTVAYRGFGASKDLVGDYTVEEISQDCLELADRLGWERFNLIGHSMGGCAMQRILADAPNRVDKMVGITPVPACGMPLPAGRLEWFRDRARNLGTAKEIIRFSVGDKISPSFVDHIHGNLQAITRAEAFAGYLDSWAPANFQDEITGRELPVKIYTAEFEHSMTVELMTKTYLEYYPNATLEILPSAGHYSINEIPLILGTNIERFLLE